MRLVEGASQDYSWIKLTYYFLSRLVFFSSSSMHDGEMPGYRTTQGQE
jgi:hypothetical protein